VSASIREYLDKIIIREVYTGPIVIVEGHEKRYT